VPIFAVTLLLLLHLDDVTNGSDTFSGKSNFTPDLTKAAFDRFEPGLTRINRLHLSCLSIVDKGAT
jgi:hypothetical protein